MIYQDFQEIDIGDGTNFTYVSFWHTLSNMKLVSLYINNVNNVETRYEFLDEADINKMVEYNSQLNTLRDALLDVKVRSMSLFTGVE